ncbi:MAG: hypothetical protein CGU28_05160 [Candidatus Dactylopiibacterium carminicum]|nr:MAG: hypothetical protein CGU28_05160 [Candidatus Dactylopiibacterium carminicum]
MIAAENTAWLAKLRYRLEDFRATAVFGKGQPCSLKIRPQTGWFSRANTPHTQAGIDAGSRGLLSSTVWLGDHDTGPEILCCLDDGPDQCTLRTQVMTLLLLIFDAARTGRSQRDPLDARLDLLLRGFDTHGNYFEQTVLTAEAGAPAIDPDRLLTAFAALGIGLKQPGRATALHG